ncbi:MAG: MFS transporter [Actinomycetia bacterium]|nr:MFS transporter [Actinomycetes bacterium]
MTEATPANTGSRLSGRRLTAAILSTTSGVLPGFLTGALGVQLRSELGFDEFGLGVAVAAFFLGGAVSSASMGRVAQHWGAARSLQTALTVTVACQLAASLAGSWIVLVAALFGSGLANGLNQPAANLLLTDGTPASRLGFGMALKQSGMPSATLLGGIAVPVFALTVGWRWAYLAGAVLALATIALIGRLDPPTGGRVSRPDAQLQSSRRTMLTLATAVGCGAFAANGMTSFLVSSAEASGLAEAAAGLTLTLGSVFGITSRLVMGARADRLTTRPLATVAAMLTLGAVGLAALGIGSTAATVLAVPLAFGAGWAWPGLFNLAVVRANPEAPAAATGFTQTGTYLGAVAGPVAMGLLVENEGYRAGWAAAAAVALIGATLASRAARLVVAETRPAAPNS